MKGDQDREIEVYTCPKCGKSFPDISNSAPPKQEELCMSCYVEEMSCWKCIQRIGEECGIDGHEVYMDSKACGSFEM